MVKNTLFILLFSLLNLSCERTHENSRFLGENHARQSLKEALSDTTDILFEGKTLIDNEETAIKYAEVLLFKVYGKETIEKERPYEAYNLDGYWIINGSLPVGHLGGTFEIIFNSKDGQIIRSVHYK